MKTNAALNVFLDEQFVGLLKEQNILAICNDVRSRGCRLRLDVMKREKLAFLRIRNGNH